MATSGSYSLYNEKGPNTYRSTSQAWTGLHRSAQSQWQAVGFAYAAADYPNGAYRLLAMPYPIIALVTAAAPLWWFIRIRRVRLRRREGRCAKCGYDLRETQDRCPECGTIAAAPPVA